MKNAKKNWSVCESGNVKIVEELHKWLILFYFFVMSLQAPFELTKKLEEVRLLESRRSPRLADQERDTDFARLADMAGDRRRSSSHSIDVPMQFTQNG